MPTINDYPAAGQVIAADNGAVTFTPHNTSYELRLAASATSPASSNQRISGLIRAQARKIYTVPSGGNFIVPIFGPPTAIQGRIRYLDESHMVVQAGAPIIVELPADDSAYDLVNGPLAVNALVNVALLPATTFEPLKAPATAR